MTKGEPTILLEIEDEANALGEAGRAMMRRCAQAAARCEGLTEAASCYVRVADDAALREVNRQTRGVDRATDVLSFPTVNYPAGRTAGECPERVAREYDPETGACALGDILISMDRVRAQAEEYGHSEAREAGYLLTHGLFHLMGYDHMTDEDKARMRAMEERALSAVGLVREEEKA